MHGITCWLQFLGPKSNNLVTYLIIDYAHFSKRIMDKLKQEKGYMLSVFQYLIKNDGPPWEFCNSFGIMDISVRYCWRTQFTLWL